MRTRKIAGTTADATLPKTPVVLGGKTYNLCLDLGALAEAETEINGELLRAGRKESVNLLFALPALNLASVRLIFAAAIRKFHPEISFDEACALVTLVTVYDIAKRIQDVWDAASPVTATPDPSRPGE